MLGVKEIDGPQHRPTLLERLGRVKVMTYVTIFGVWAGVVIGIARYVIVGEPLWLVLLVAFGPALPVFMILMAVDWRSE